MSLAPGARLGVVYEVRDLIGAGGMGEVYRAYDTRLNRHVALKILPDLFARDPERLARFKREAQVLASLNHANIASIFGFEESDGVQALVLELVEGPTLAESIERGPHRWRRRYRRPADRRRARSCARPRDRSPGSEAREHQVPAGWHGQSAGFRIREGARRVMPRRPASGQSLTITSPAMTQLGVILGTAAYMSPEQARGKPVDKRSDIWAFGGVLYEMLTGKRAFDGDDVSDTLANVLDASRTGARFQRRRQRTFGACCAAVWRKIPGGESTTSPMCGSNSTRRTSTTQPCRWLSPIMF